MAFSRFLFSVPPLQKPVYTSKGACWEYIWRDDSEFVCVGVCICDITSNKTYPQARECTVRVEEGKNRLKLKNEKHSA